MSIILHEILSEGLSLLTYNKSSLSTPKDHYLNIFMGIGLWSVKDGLSEGLPIDVMQMLLSAAMLRSQILETNPSKSSKVIVLIADSMAVREGADKEKVSQIAQIYKKSLESLLGLLNLKESAEIALSSNLETCLLYQEVLENIHMSKKLEQLKKEDEIHYNYVLTQTAITSYMCKHEQAGVKIGWICSESKIHLEEQSAQSLKHWDELKFDRWCQKVCKDSPMQYLYTKAGLKQSTLGKHIHVREGCPYTAFAKDQRYIVQTQTKTDIKTICPIQKRVVVHWKGTAEVCSQLMQANIVNSQLLPENCVHKTNAVVTVSNLLNHWINAPLLDTTRTYPQALPPSSPFPSTEDQNAKKSNKHQII